MHYLKVRELDLFVDGSFRTVDISKSQGIISKIGKLKSNTNAECIQSYTFNDKWTSQKAAEWVKEHEKKTIEEVLFLNKDHEISDNSIEKRIKYFRAKVLSIDEKNYTARCVFSTEQKDRDEEILPVSSWEKRIKTFAEHPVLVSSHNYKGLQNQIGEIRNFTINKSEKRTEGDVVWYAGLGNAEADWGWVLAKKGVAMFSKGYIPYKYLHGEDIPKEYKSENPKNVQIDNELLEVSQVIVGSNRGALQMGIDNPTVEQNQYAFDVIKSFGNQIPDFNAEIKPEPPVTKTPELPIPPVPPTPEIPVASAVTPAKVKSDSIIISPIEVKNMEDLQEFMNIYKSGRVISEKNRATIKSTLEQLDAVMKALNNLIELTEPKQEEENTDKSFKQKVDEILKSII